MGEPSNEFQYLSKVITFLESPISRGFTERSLAGNVGNITDCQIHANL